MVAINITIIVVLRNVQKVLDKSPITSKGFIYIKDAIEPYHAILSCYKYGRTIPYNIPYIMF